MIIKEHSVLLDVIGIRGIELIREDSDENQKDFSDFIVDLCNSGDIETIWLSEIQSCGNWSAGHYIVACIDCDIETVWVDPYEYEHFKRDGFVFIPFQDDVYTDDDITMMLEGTYKD